MNASEWTLREINDDLAMHMFPESKYNWSTPKQLFLWSDEQGNYEYSMYAERLSPGMFVTVNKREDCNAYNSQVIV